MSRVNKLSTESVSVSFFKYLIPSLIGMALMSINIVIDGIFVGHGVGSTALAGINIAVPVFSIILSVALLIGVGGGAVFSMALGAGKVNYAQGIFTTSFALLTIIVILITSVSLFFIKDLAFFFGANEDTLPYALEYMKILLLFGLLMAWETALSVFVRNDGNPNLAMIGLVLTSVLNIGLNYYMIFILQLGVTGAAIATIIATTVGLFVLLTHFFKSDALLKFVSLSWKKKDIKQISSIGFPSFLSEIGMGVFTISYNITIVFYAGTIGLAAFSVLNYLHTFMFLLFMGIGSSIQPMISYYHGARLDENIKETIKIGEKTALVIGSLFLLIGYLGASPLVAMFGIASGEITKLAETGIKLFFIGYVFMGVNFIYLTYFQSIGNVRSSLLITLFRGFILLILMLFVLPKFIGTNGVWLAFPVSEAIVALFLLTFIRNDLIGRIDKRIRSVKY